MKTKLLILFMLAITLVSACAPVPTPFPTPNVPFIQTSAAQTVIANFTLTAQAGTSTPLPALTPTIAVQNTPTTGPSPTASPTLPGGITATPQLCNALTFDNATVDVNVPDNTQMTAGQQFVKTWLVKNNGTCTWGAGYGLVYAKYNDPMSGKPEPLSGPVVPGQEVQVSVQFVAPSKSGQYVSAWEMADASGNAFPKVIFVKIIVK